MRYYVNEKCISCGLCTSICPEVFSMNDEGVAVATQNTVPHEDADSADEAKESCPVDAIEEA
ncbi:MAG: ferredoxin [Clostridiales bacterium]|nr:ferredoxin [Clostridiales bacterium]